MSDENATPFELTNELAERTREVVRALLGAGVIPAEGVPGWIAGAVVTAIVMELREADDGVSG